MEEKRVFHRTKSLLPKHTHYCPGCHHGIAHRLVCEVIDELNKAEDTLLVASVGCSAFIYDYMDFDCIEAPHGRASGVATGVKRARPEKVVFAYQGDGDLASIGIAEAIHAANRGEGFTVIFINNSVYGMTGGQMAPTTLVGQKTTTSPAGRNFEKEGGPLKMAELMSNLDAVSYCARGALDSIPHIRQAKKMIRQAFEAQINHNAYGFVELLCGCPTNWRMDAIKANEYIGTVSAKHFPIGVYKEFKEGENV